MVCWCEVSSVNGSWAEEWVPSVSGCHGVRWSPLHVVGLRMRSLNLQKVFPARIVVKDSSHVQVLWTIQDSAGSSLKDGSFHAIDVSPGVQWTIHIEGSSEEHTNNIRSRWWSSVASSSPFGKWRQRLNQAVSPHPCKLRWRSLAWCRGKMLEKSERQRWGRRCPIFIWADICDRVYQPPGFDRMPFTTTRLPKSAEKTSLDIGVSFSRT